MRVVSGDEPRGTLGAGMLAGGVLVVVEAVGIWTGIPAGTCGEPWGVDPGQFGAWLLSDEEEVRAFAIEAEEGLRCCAAANTVTSNTSMHT
jgi:hypothetical protein